MHKKTLLRCGTNVKQRSGGRYTQSQNLRKFSFFKRNQLD